MIHLALVGVDAGLGMGFTLLVHGALWALAAVLIASFWPGLAASTQHRLWRAALVGPLASSTLVLVLGQRWQWLPFGAQPLEPHPSELVGAAADPAAVASSAASELAAGAGASVSTTALLVAGWAIVAATGLLLLAREASKQRRALAGRRPLTGWPRTLLERLQRRAGSRALVQLSESASVNSPVVLGHSEICLPERARTLDAPSLEAVLAHELAHIERADGAWLRAALVLQAIFWFQPLGRWLLGRLRASAELAADDRAVLLTGDPLSLARTLTEVASWSRPGGPQPAVAMARAGSPIVERVARLVDATDATPLPPRRVRQALALGVLIAVGACAPSVGAPRASANPRHDIAPPSVALAPSAPMPPDTSAPSVPPPPSPPAPPQATASAPGASAPLDADVSIPHIPTAPIGAVVTEVIDEVVPRAVEFSQKISMLAMASAGLEARMAAAKQRVARGGPELARARAELAELERRHAETSARLEAAEREFERGMDAWSKAFEAQMASDFAPRFEAWGRELGRNMEEMAERIERRTKERTPGPHDTTLPVR